MRWSRVHYPAGARMIPGRRVGFHTSQVVRSDPPCDLWRAAPEARRFRPTAVSGRGRAETPWPREATNRRATPDRNWQRDSDD